MVEHPEIREEVVNKNEQLAGFLKGMVVNPERIGQVRNVSVAPSKTYTVFRCLVVLDTGT